MTMTDRTTTPKTCDHDPHSLNKTTTMEFTGKCDGRGRLIFKCTLCGHPVHIYAGG